MTLYPATKTLTSATPTIVANSGIVTSWNIKVNFTTINATPSFSRDYQFNKDNLDYLNKTPSQFTQQDLIAYIPPNMDVIFDAHYEATNLPPLNIRVDNFSLANLSTANT